MFNGNRITEHEENVVRIGEKESENGSNLLLKNIFFSKAIAC